MNRSITRGPYHLISYLLFTKTSTPPPPTQIYYHIAIRIDYLFYLIMPMLTKKYSRISFLPYKAQYYSERQFNSIILLQRPKETIGRPSKAVSCLYFIIDGLQRINIYSKNNIMFSHNSLNNNNKKKISSPIFWKEHNQSQARQAWQAPAVIPEIFLCGFAAPKAIFHFHSVWYQFDS